MTPTIKRAKLPRHREADTPETTDREIMLGGLENFNWLPGFGKHRANTQEAK